MASSFFTPHALPLKLFEKCVTECPNIYNYLESKTHDAKNIQQH